MTAQHWSLPFIGLPYAHDGEGPHAFNCWFFLRHVQRARFGRELPALSSPPTLLGQARALTSWADAFGWVEVERPISGDAVYLSQLTHASHVGVYVADVASGSVLHCLQGAGSVCTPASVLRDHGWKILGYYRPAGEVR